MKNILIIGAGFSGSVVAERLCNAIDCKVTILDERNHIGGNCHSKRDEATGVMVHTYGPHIFNTDNKEVWDYINRFTEMMPYVHRVKAVYKNRVYSLPINLHTINQYFEKCLTPAEAKAFIEDLGEKTILEPKNFEEQALKFLGKDLYYAFFYGYTKKQWGCEPRELPASILKRLPIRFNYNDNYHTNLIQGIPKDGYTAIFEKMLDHKNIEVRLNTKFSNNIDVEQYDHVFYTGPIDAFFEYKYGRLGYRTVAFERYEANGDFQGASQINYTEEGVAYTRICEPKHFTPWETHEKTVYFKEFSKETSPSDIPYYPKRLQNDMEILGLYQEEVNKIYKYTFLGRLATYRYMDMHQVIGEALEVSRKFLKNII